MDLPRVWRYRSILVWTLLSIMMTLVIFFLFGFAEEVGFSPDLFLFGRVFVVLLVEGDGSGILLSLFPPSSVLLAEGVRSTWRSVMCCTSSMVSMDSSCGSLFSLLQGKWTTLRGSLGAAPELDFPLPKADLPFNEGPLGSSAVLAAMGSKLVMKRGR